MSIRDFYPQQQFPLWNLPAQQPAPTLGWECPKCRSVFAPWVARCQECRPQPESTPEPGAPPCGGTE